MRTNRATLRLTPRRCAAGRIDVAVSIYPPRGPAGAPRRLRGGGHQHARSGRGSRATPRERGAVAPMTTLMASNTGITPAAALDLFRPRLGDPASQRAALLGIAPPTRS